MFNLYRIISFIFLPFIFLIIYFRIINNKEDKKRYKERFGIATISRPKKEIIWMHATSVGEFKSCKFVIESYYKKYQILITTTTKSAAEYANQYYGDKIIHQYAPFDIQIWVEKFLLYWKPKIVLWIESDLWPNTIFAIKKHKIESLFLNARISPKSFERWNKIPNYYNKILNTFNKIYAQSKEDQKRLEILSNSKIEFIGNLKLAKYSDEDTLYESNKNAKFNIMFASTHYGEEEKLLPLIKNLYHKYSSIQFYIAPRHPEKSNLIQKLFNQNKLSIIKESEKKDFESRIIIIDSFGNLSNFYRNSEIVFLGGSILKKGGHNPIEAALYNCAIISGNQIFNWQNIYEEMANEKACYLSDNIVKIQEYIENLINNENMMEKSKRKALKFAQKKFFDEEKLKDVINSVLI